MRLELSHRLEQVLTPQLILNLKILQLPTLELEQLIRSELEQNPALEESDDPADASDLSDQQPEQVEAEPVEPEAAETGPAEMEAVGVELLGRAASAPGQPEGEASSPESEDYATVSPSDDYSIKDLMPNDAYMPLPSSAGGGDDDVGAAELAAGPEMGLREAILPTLRCHLNDEDGALAETLLEWVDEEGFLGASPEELAAKLDVDVERVRAILHVMQRVPPGGIGCADVRASLLVQLELGGYGPESLERKLLSDHWELLTHKQTAKIAKLCGVSEDDVRQAVGRILCLEPKPARRFTGTTSVYVSPDFSVEWESDRLVAIPSDDCTPRLRLSRRYVEMLRHPHGVPKEQLDFARKKFNAAVMFLRAIESRRRTVKNLVELVINEQREFFVSGPEFLRPATLRQAAGKLGVHPSTASRAIAGKYLETSLGIFPLKYFFKAGTGDKSRTSIKEKMLVIINAEDKAHPLSDEEIAARLKEQNVSVSRRTVAKYRGELNVPGCNERKGF